MWKSAKMSEIEANVEEDSKKPYKVGGKIQKIILKLRQTYTDIQ